MAAPTLMGSILGGTSAGISSGIGSLIGGGISSLFGDDTDRYAYRYAAQQDRSAQAFARQEAGKDRALQKTLAQEGVRWRVADAKAAGLHPLYAMGASIAQGSPAAVGVSPSVPQGQNVARAYRATSTSPQRRNSILEALAVERAGLENDLLRAKITLATQTGPAFPSQTPGLIPGQGDANDLITNVPQQRVVSDPGHTSQEPGAISDTGFAKTPTGYAPIPSSDVKERIEDQMIPELMWAIRNLLLPNIGKGLPPPKPWRMRGTKWKWNHARQEWQHSYPGRRRPKRRSSGW